MGVATGVFQYANSSPVANGSYQWKLSSDAIRFGSTQNCTVPTIINGNLDSSGNLTTTFAFNDVLSTTAGAVTTYQLTVKAQNGGQVWNENYYLTGTAANLNLIPPSAGSPFSTVTTSSVTLPAAQLGDTIRYNVNGDIAWDAVNFAQPVSTVLAVMGNDPIVTGPYNIGFNKTSSGTTDQFPTTTSGPNRQYYWNTGATNVCGIGMWMGEGGNNALFGIMTFYRWSMKAFISPVASNARYWMGLCTWNLSGTGGNVTQVGSTTRFANDTPNCTVIGFRYSAGTDVNFKAVSSLVGASTATATIVDTGVAADTNPHLFEMATNSNSSAIVYLIDNTPVATITTNLPNPNSNDSLAEMFWSGDNKNTNTNVSMYFYSMRLSHKM